MSTLTENHDIGYRPRDPAMDLVPSAEELAERRIRAREALAIVESVVAAGARRADRVIQFNVVRAKIARAALAIRYPRPESIATIRSGPEVTPAAAAVYDLAVDNTASADQAVASDYEQLTIPKVDKFLRRHQKTVRTPVSSFNPEEELPHGDIYSSQPRLDGFTELVTAYALDDTLATAPIEVPTFNPELSKGPSTNLPQRAQPPQEHTHENAAMDALPSLEEESDSKPSRWRRLRESRRIARINRREARMTRAERRLSDL